MFCLISEVSEVRASFYWINPCSCIPNSVPNPQSWIKWASWVPYIHGSMDPWIHGIHGISGSMIHGSKDSLGPWSHHPWINQSCIHETIFARLINAEHKQCWKHAALNAKHIQHARPHKRVKDLPVHGATLRAGSAGQ